MPEDRRRFPAAPLHPPADPDEAVCHGVPGGGARWSSPNCTPPTRRKSPVSAAGSWPIHIRGQGQENVFYLDSFAEITRVPAPPAPGRRRSGFPLRRQPHPAGPRFCRGNGDAEKMNELRSQSLKFEAEFFRKSNNLTLTPRKENPLDPDAQRSCLAAAAHHPAGRLRRL